MKNESTSIEKSILAAEISKEGYYKYQLPTTNITPIDELLDDDIHHSNFVIEISKLKLNKYLEYLSKNNCELLKSLQGNRKYKAYLVILFKALTCSTETAICITGSHKHRISKDLAISIFQSLKDFDAVYLLAGYKDPKTKELICRSAYPKQTSFEEDMRLVNEGIEYQSTQETQAKSPPTSAFENHPINRNSLIKIKDKIQKAIDHQIKETKELI